MDKSKLFISLMLAISLSACVTVKVPQATGGSRADGIIDLSYQFGRFEKPQIDWNQARNTAAVRCKAWGYSDAEAFGGQTKQCLKHGDFGCEKHQINTKYQCIGKD